MLKKITRLGEISYRKLGEFVGDHTIETEVIARYLDLKTDSPDNASIAITPENYHFRPKSMITQGDSKIYVFELKPKKKAVGLFKGELWLDAFTGMPVRETGTLVKTPSIFLKSVAFVNEFKLQNGVAWPSRVECHVDVRVFGPANLSVQFGNVAPLGDDDDVKEIAAVP